MQGRSQAWLSRHRCRQEAWHLGQGRGWRESRGTCLSPDLSQQCWDGGAGQGLPPACWPAGQCSFSPQLCPVPHEWPAVSGGSGEGREQSLRPWPPQQTCPSTVGRGPTWCGIPSSCCLFMECLCPHCLVWASQVTRRILLPTAGSRLWQDVLGLGGLC